MTEGEHTIISKIPRERLNQIAGRKLAALGIPVRLGADRETLEGDLAFATRLPLPPGGTPVVRGRFVVEGHDHLRFVEPPLSALAPVRFQEVERSGELEARVGGLVADRVAELDDLAARLRALRVEAAVEPGRLLVRAVVKTSRNAFELLGGPEGVRLARAAPVGGKPFEVPPSVPRVVLGEHASAASLGAWLEARLGEVQGAAQGVPTQGVPPPQPGAASTRPAAPRPAPGAGVLEEQPPPRNAVTLGRLVEAFGADAVVAPTAALELVREYRDASTQYRFVATREVGPAFRGRLIGPGGDVWADRFDLDRFPGVTRVVAGALGVGNAGAPAAGAGAGGAPAAGAGAGGAPAAGAAAGAGAEESASALVAAASPLPGGTASVPQHLLPHPGEVWVMNVVVEQMGEEVRYVGTDIDGRPYGAARVLRRSDFEAVFAADRGSWRLLVVVDQVQGGGIVYRQLDRQRQPLGAPRAMAVGVLVANFVPEAAAY